ncbi:hypothetical protein K503DRAFT_784816 [Rhizopogon vinicolor AM-OR11-026]|uniref:Uncharacterized protein n=1 Tax=Rhizopogon vinicolor AM-OR11-026 TaxID=1314800 RepID=A0A1B7MT62_9AGAM|nr:hypothetical protein K503DRAFT_784816 [Rhizopogon vinicolor AM-OR11-026]
MSIGSRRVWHPLLPRGWGLVPQLLNKGLGALESNFGCYSLLHHVRLCLLSMSIYTGPRVLTAINSATVDRQTGTELAGPNLYVVLYHTSETLRHSLPKTSPIYVNTYQAPEFSQPSTVLQLISRQALNLKYPNNTWAFFIKLQSCRQKYTSMLVIHISAFDVLRVTSITDSFPDHRIKLVGELQVKYTVFFSHRITQFEEI